MPLYEVLLLLDTPEIRLTDRSLRIGETLAIGEQSWLVEDEAAPEREDALTRFVCVPADAVG